MSKRLEPKSKSTKRTLRFVATTAMIVAPAAFVACGGAKHAPESGNVDVEEHTNVGREDDVPEGSNVDHTAEPHTNVGPEEESASGGDEAAPE